jgi:UDP-N-acetyl-D-mannosaminuronate dehydrogenase
MPEYAVGLLEKALGGLQGAKLAVLGAGYRGGVKETAFSGVFPLVALLKGRGAYVRVHDPLFSADELATLGLDAYRRGEPVEAVVLQADHDEYGSWTVADCPGCRIVVDGRNVLRAEAWLPAQVIGVGFHG